MIELENISKTYLKSLVLNNISLKIPVNSITGFIGPNGAGKSTLIKIISGFEYPDRGSLFIDDKKINSFKDLINLISYMPENMTLYPEYFVDDFLDFFHSSVNFEDDDLLKRLSLKTVYNKRIKHLSKGWNQRLKLYTALCNNKRIIVLDEPFDGFDPFQLFDIIEIFKTQRENGRSFILSIHQLNYAEKICDYFVLLNDGKLIADGIIDDLKKKYSKTLNNLEEIFIEALKR